MDNIIDTLYAGDCDDAWKVAEDDNFLGINAVWDLRAEASGRLEETFEARGYYKYINSPMWDATEIPDFEDFGNLIVSISMDLVQKRKTLINCAAGVSRTCIVVCAVLVLHYGMDPYKALDYAKSRRSCFLPHPTLWKSFIDYLVDRGYYQRIDKNTSMFNN